MLVKKRWSANITAREDEEARNTRGRRSPSRATFKRLSGGRMNNLLARFVREDEGQDLTEYALLVAFIAFFVLFGVQLFGTALNDWWGRVAGQFDTMNPS
jgi:Flp pilus assembly pilin Flp